MMYSSYDQVEAAHEIRLKKLSTREIASSLATIEDRITHLENVKSELFVELNSRNMLEPKDKIKVKLS